MLNNVSFKVKKPGSRNSKEGKGTVSFCKITRHPVLQNCNFKPLQVKSSASWTNEEFGKIYEPVSATELRRQHQVKV